MRKKSYQNEIHKSSNETHKFSNQAKSKSKNKNENKNKNNNRLNYLLSSAEPERKKELESEKVKEKDKDKEKKFIPKSITKSKITIKPFSNSMISHIKKEILFLGDDNGITNINKKQKQKPKLSNIIDEFFIKFHGTFNKKLKLDINKILRILKEKYDSRKELTINNINQDIEIDMIFKDNDNMCIFILILLLILIIYFLNR
jgi:hypothetical protein